jgi:hypothetical protein
MKKMTLKKFSLNRETLRHLNDEQSKEAKGGSEIAQNWTTGEWDSHPQCCV